MKTSIISTLAAVGLGLGVSLATLPVQAGWASWWAVSCQGDNGLLWINDYATYSEAVQASYRCQNQGGKAQIDSLL